MSRMTSKTASVPIGTAPIQALMAARARPEGGSWARDVPRRRRPYAGQRLELAGYASAVRLQ
jgi:hypothetical protein